MSVDVEAIKDLATHSEELSLEWRERILTLAAELEQAERERDAAKAHGDGHLADEAIAQKEASEAALRTLRQAAKRVIEEFHDPELELRVGKIVLDNLAAALAAEGGK